jgi:TonB-linked SusC/RagA family outer membrane protein
MQVRGVVVDAANNAPLAGVSVRVANSQTITITGANGDYTISANRGESLVFSSIGMKPLTVVVTQPVLNVALEEDATKLEELIVVAYGVVRPEAKTGSVATVTGPGIAEIPITSVDKMLAGKMAGVQITASSGQPGAESNIRVRGISSVNASNEPLWVVDGIPVMTGNNAYFTNTGNSLASMNPSDIESITVLKDAAAASVYGSRAANGVILVTTKKGKEGKSQFTARAKYGVSWLANDNNFRVMTGAELLGFQRQSIINAGRDPDDPTNPGRYRPMSILEKPQTDWLGALSRGGILKEGEVNATGGNNKASYYSSLSYHKNDGVFLGIDYSRISARINADYKLTNSITSGARVNFAYTESNDVPMQSLFYANPLFAGLTMLPWSPIYDEDGEYNYPSENGGTNPLATAQHDPQYEKKYVFFGSSYVEWKPFRTVAIKTNNAIETDFGDGIRLWTPEANPWQENDDGSFFSVLQQSKTSTVQLTTSNTITFSDVFNDNHSVRVLLGQEAMKRTYNEMYYMGSVDPLMPIIQTSQQEDLECWYDYDARTLLSFFGILDYSFSGKYYLQASMRGDGSSLFGANKKWGLFWSVGGSWNVHNEGFMKNQHIFDLLKLRLSYGVNGNNGIRPYRACGVYSSTTFNGYPGLRPTSPSNENLSWERNLTWNAGVDFGFLNRFNASIDLYTRNTEDMLLNKTVPQTSGFSTNFVNIGKINNKGIEFKLDADLFRSKSFSWNAGFNIAFNKSEVVDLAGVDFIIATLTDGSGEQDARLRHAVGRRVYSYHVYDYYGVNPVNGEPLFRTEGGELTNNFNLAARIYAGSPEPKYTGGFFTSVDWKGFNFSTFLEFKGGNHVALFEKRYLLNDGNQNMNQLATGLNYWKKPGDTGVNPKPLWQHTNNSYNASSSRYLQRGDYTRIKDITLSYTLPKKISDKLQLSNLKLYVSGLNIYTFHKVDWYDPERGVDGAGWGIYPMTKSFIGGIELSF